MLFARRAALVTVAALVLGGIVTALWLGPLSGTSGDSDTSGNPGGPGHPGDSPDSGGPAVAADVVGPWGSRGERQPHLSLTEDGAVSGNDGCNGFSGAYTLGPDGTITFHGVLGTLKACLGVDTWLHRLDSATLEDGRLVVFNAAGEEIGRLSRG